MALAAGVMGKDVTSKPDFCLTLSHHQVAVRFDGRARWIPRALVSCGEAGEKPLRHADGFLTHVGRWTH